MYVCTLYMFIYMHTYIYTHAHLKKKTDKNHETMFTFPR